MSWNEVIAIIKPELILIGAACVLFLLGVFRSPGARKAAPVIALLALVAVCVLELARPPIGGETLADSRGAFHVSELAHYVRLLSAGICSMFVLLSWPTDREATGNAALQFGHDAGEYFGLMLLAISGIFIVATANDIILLFLGIELASIPTYVMVSISRPLPVAQEAGVKYFFLGAMSAAVMLFGFSYLYGSTGLFKLDEITAHIAHQAQSSINDPAKWLTDWQLLAVLMLIAGFAFKMAAFPLHFYAGDVYEGAATPVTAMLSFVPKITGFVALIKLLFCVTAGSWIAPPQIVKLMWVMAVVTMSVGNILGLVQRMNVKRLLAYSSVAHSGYMLVGITALLTTQATDALTGVLFYLAAYGIMNVAAFGVLMLLPSKSNKPATSAETFDDIAGVGRQHPVLGLAMAVACFSLIGLPLTIGFFGKIYLIRPALEGHNYWLVVLTMVNAAVSAAYYLEIVRRMFLAGDPRPATPGATPVTTPTAAPPFAHPVSVVVAVALSTAGTLLFGIVLPATEVLRTRTIEAATVDSQPNLAPPAVTSASVEAAP